MTEYLPVTAQVIVLVGIVIALGFFVWVCIWAWHKARRMSEEESWWE